MVSNKSGGGKIANNLAVTEEGFALDARQGKVLDEKIKQTSDNLSKMIQASGVLGGNVDWDNYMTAGVYQVQATTMTAEYHAPVGIYGYGILDVLVSEMNIGYRASQIYYPHQIFSNVILVLRMFNNDTWTPWFKISGQPLE